MDKITKILLKYTINFVKYLLNYTWNSLNKTSKKRENCLKFLTLFLFNRIIKSQI